MRPTFVRTDYAWHAQALCRKLADPDAWFPDEEKPPHTSEAREVCARCPVRAACLDDALAQPVPPHGIWGGTTTRQRLRAPRKTPHRQTQRPEQEHAA